MAKRVNTEGMRYPSVDKLLDKYKLAYIAAKRAKIIEEEDYCAAEDSICAKPVGQALEEILEDKVHCDFKE